jgi:hypothetical protein
MLSAVTQSVVAAAGRVLDRFPWSAPVIRALAIGWDAIVFAGAACAIAVAQGPFVFWFSCAAAVVGIRVLYVWLGLRGGARLMSRLVGDPATFQQSWSCVDGPRVRGLIAGCRARAAGGNCDRVSGRFKRLRRSRRPLEV